MNVRPIEDRLGLPRVKRSHTFLRWQQYSQQSTLTRVLCYRTGLSREQMCLWFTGYPKRRAATSGLGHSRRLASGRAGGQCPQCSVCDRGRAAPQTDAMCHVWTAPSWQELSSRLQHWSVQPCVRPVCAVHMTAGHNALRGSGPGQFHAFDNAVAHVGCPDRRIDRLCITCCSPSQPSHHAEHRRDLVHAATATGSL